MAVIVQRILLLLVPRSPYFSGDPYYPPLVILAFLVFRYIQFVWSWTSLWSETLSGHSGALTSVRLTWISQRLWTSLSSSPRLSTVGLWNVLFFVWVILSLGFTLAVSLVYRSFSLSVRPPCICPPPLACLDPVSRCLAPLNI